MSREVSGLAWLGFEQPAIGHSLGALSCCPPPPTLDHFHLLLLQLNGLHVNTALEPGHAVDVSGPGFKSESEREKINTGRNGGDGEASRRCMHGRRAHACVCVISHWLNDSRQRASPQSKAAGMRGIRTTGQLTHWPMFNTLDGPGIKPACLWVIGGGIF